MVVANRKLVEREMKQHGLSVMALAVKCGCHIETIRGILAGKNVGRRMQTQLYQGLAGAVPMNKLFAVVPEYADND